jgi:hypothetical protein
MADPVTPQQSTGLPVGITAYHASQRETRRELKTRGTRLLLLEAEARYARDRYRLYRARVSSGRPTSPGRLRELERQHRRAESRLRRTKSGETRLLAALPPHP